MCDLRFIQFKTCEAFNQFSCNACNHLQFTIAYRGEMCPFASFNNKMKGTKQCSFNQKKKKYRFQTAPIANANGENTVQR